MLIHGVLLYCWGVRHFAQSFPSSMSVSQSACFKGQVSFHETTHGISHLRPVKSAHGRPGRVNSHSCPVHWYVDKQMPWKLSLFFWGGQGYSKQKLKGKRPFRDSSVWQTIQQLHWAALCSDKMLSRWFKEGGKANFKHFAIVSKVHW